MKPDACSNCALIGDDMVAVDGHRHPDIVFVGGFPLPHDIKVGAFESKAGKVVKRIVSDAQKRVQRAEQAKPAYVYAVRCCPQSVEFKTTAKIVEQCAQYLWEYLDRTRPKVVVAMGADALKALKIKGSVSHWRGATTEVPIAGEKTPVLVTYHPSQVNKTPGLLPVFKNDVHKALKRARGGVTDEELDISTPKDLQGILAALDTLEEAADQCVAEKGKPLGVSMDTETNTLNMHLDGARCIAISMSWGNNQGLAFPYKHKDSELNPQDIETIKTRLQEILNSGKIVLLFHNAKFDYKVLNLREEFDIPFAEYDSMLAEHVLDEDKKGEYSLKQLTIDYFPTMGKYEEELKAALAEIDAAREQEYKEAWEQYKAECDKLRVDFWMQLTEDQRGRLIGEWLDTYRLPIKDAPQLVEVKTRKLKGEQVVLKKYINAVNKMLKTVPPELSGVDLPTFDVPEPEPATFEDVDIDMMLRYAGVDAAVTRKIVGTQSQHFAKDNELIRGIETKLNISLPTKPARWGLNNISMPLCKSLSEMEYYGVRLDRDKTRDYIETLSTSLAEYADTMFTHAGREFNTSSSSGDLKKILFDEMGFPVVKFTDKGEKSTDAETIKELSERYENPFLDALAKHRKIEKCINTYLKNWLKMSEADGKIHCNFNQIGTATYRLSSSSPNLQNVPFQLKEANLNLKSLFLADSYEYDVYDLDISNAEMRVLCAYSRDENLINAFNTGKDLHCLTAAGISDYTYEDILANKEDKTTDQFTKRQVAKKVMEN